MVLLAAAPTRAQDAQRVAHRVLAAATRRVGEKALVNFRNALSFRGRLVVPNGEDYVVTSRQTTVNKKTGRVAGVAHGTDSWDTPLRSVVGARWDPTTQTGTVTIQAASQDSNPSRVFVLQTSPTRTVVKDGRTELDRYLETDSGSVTPTERVTTQHATSVTHKGPIAVVTTSNRNIARDLETGETTVNNSRVVRSVKVGPLRIPFSATWEWRGTAGDRPRRP